MARGYAALLLLCLLWEYGCEFHGRTKGRRAGRHWRARPQRTKRGWVWNQFFVLEEYMGSEPQYVGKCCRSRKPSPNNRLNVIVKM
uniref:Uncharacterized protein n=1 Tax=Knipowitschia caucasica TaxID=637954 RepID=A0AAV2JSU0_KNICA